MAGTAVAGARGPAEGTWLCGGAAVGQGERAVRRGGKKTARGSGVGLGALCLVLLFVSSVSAFAAPPIVWVAPSLTRVSPDTAAGSATQIDLYAAKGEYESFQIIVKAPDGGLTGVNVTAPNLQGPQFTLYREHYIYLARGTSDWASNRNKPLGAGWYPDGLIPFVNPATGADLTGATLDAVPFSLAAGKNQPIWVDVFVPRETAAGRYSGVFTVTSNQGQASATLNLTVWDFTLPVKPALESSILYWTVRGQLQPEQELLRNRLMPTSINSADASGLMAEGLGAANMGFWSGADGTTCISTNPPPSSSTVASTASRYPSGLRLYAYTADEISHCAGLLPTMQQYASALHSANVDQLITMPPKSDWVGVVDIWVELPKQYVASDVQGAIGRGESVWSYNCLQQDDYSPKWLLDYAPINYRIQPGFINQVLGMTGLLYWRADYWTSDPWNNVATYSASYPAEGLLVYPGQQVGISGVAPSMRLKYLRDGVDDYDYIQLLKQRGLSDWALGVARSVGPDWSNWTRDPNAVEAARRQLGERLNGLSSPHSLTVTAAASPSMVASAGSATLSATATDSLGHGIALWSWSDGGAGGTFSPSASVQSPNYVAPPNTSGADRVLTLTVSVTCSGSPAATSSKSVTITEQPAAVAAHAVSVIASASPTSIESGGTVSLNASASDNQGHTGLAWAWSDNGAGGQFLPSATVQNPTWVAPPNASGQAVIRTLTVTATCKWYYPWVSTSAEITVNEGSSVHAVTVTANASPTTVESGRMVSLSASATDSLGHSIASWAWSDGSAGGLFAPSATVQNPSYTAPPNLGSSAKAVTLTVTATCSGPSPLSKSASTSISVTPAEHTLAVSASALPTEVASVGVASLSASAADSRGHAIALWHWDDAGAGGKFLPSAAAQNPSYTAPTNSTASNMVVTLTVTATCSGSTPISAMAATSLLVRPILVALTVEASAPMPSMVPSEGTAQLQASANDGALDGAASWQWSDGGANGAFDPSSTVRTPAYHAPKNTTDKQMQVRLTVTASFTDPVPMSGSDVAILMVEPAQHALRVTAVAAPSNVGWRGKATLSAYASDSLAHAIARWQWSDGSAGGSFSPSRLAQNPTYRAPTNLASVESVVVLTVTATCAGAIPLTASGTILLRVAPKPNQKFVSGDGAPLGEGDLYSVPSIRPGGGAAYSDVPDGFWALAAINACRDADLVVGYPDGSYQPSQSVTREQIAVYLARALTGGDAMVPAGPAEPSFADVPESHWAYRHIEYARERGVVDGYPDGLYRPTAEVNRAEMATFIARSVTEPVGEAGLNGYMPPAAPTFSDVPADFWAYKHIEYLASRGLAGGFEDGSYRPGELCNRAQAAVYLARAFGLM